MRILLTNDDGIDSIGLHVLARAMRPHGDVVIAAPDKEYSGAGAALGTLHLIRPEVRRVDIDGIDEAWAISGPPALCVMFSRLGAFGEPFDLVVAGINPGVNVGRSVYHSGTIGAALTARNGQISGVAVSQAVAGNDIEGQASDDMLAGQRWDTAAAVASAFVGGLVAAMPVDPVVVNLNVPNVDMADIRGWRRARVGLEPPRRVSSATLEPKLGHEGAFHVTMSWGDALDLPPDSDGGLVEAGYVAISYLSRMEDHQRDDMRPGEHGLDGILAG
ncbi:MAG: 5-nucleotidase SurE [Ilumatobacteraceae bacterium]|nr:5-nucleotidase SurE [Ilumatobacteraceae bacterium]